MKKLLSVFLVVVMVMSLVTVTSAEDVTVTTITQNDVMLDGRTNMPLSFTPTVTFAVPVTEGTDLTGITVTKDGVAIDGVTAVMGTVTKPTNEEGEVDESATGTFTTATVEIPVLETNSTYALEVPAIGDNIPASASFSTIPSPYYIKEDFNGEINGNWNSARTSGRLGMNALKDTDGDGVSDAFYYNSYYHSTYFQPQDTPLTTTELIYETRVKWTPRSASNANEDGTIKGNADNNNGGLLRLYSSSSYWARIKADADGNLCYGNTNADTITTDYKIYKDTWYTVRFTFNNTRRGYKVDIVDDNGNVYNGEYASTSYNGGVFNAIGDVSYSYGAYYMATIDYLYAWDGNLIEAPSVTYNNGENLDGAEGINAATDLTATVTFTNPITEFDLDAITLNSSLEVTKNLESDNKTVTLVISNMAFNATYTLKVPEIGMNKGVSAVFKTGGEPKKSITQNGANLDGQTDMPVAFTSTVEFATPVAEGTVLPSATITSENGDVIEAAITAATAKDGYFTTATIATPLLENATSYTISVPAIAGNLADTATFTTVSEHFVAKEEFNGIAKGNWHHDYSADTQLRSVATWLDTDDDGLTDAVYLTGVRPSLRFPGNVVHATTCSSANVSETFFGELTYETKVKFSSNDGKPNEDGSLYSGDTNNGMLLSIRSVSTNRNAMVKTSKDGFLQYGGTSGTNIITDYKIYVDTWYTFRISLTNDTKKMKVFVIDENGNVYDGEYTGIRYGWPIDDVAVAYSYRYLSWASLNAADYMYLYDNADSSLGDVTATYADGAVLDEATDIDKDEALEATLTFANEITEADLEKIVVSNGATAEMVLSDDQKTVNLTISGLEYNEKYYISVSTLGANKAKEFSFTTESAPVTAFYNNGTEDVVLEGATEVPVEFSGKIAYGIALDPATDVSGITVNGGNVTATLNADGTEISYTVSGLDVASKYTLSIPALGASNALEVKFATVMNQYLFKAEFDENDIDAYSFSDTNNTITDGILNLPGTPGGTVTRVNPIDVIDLTGRNDVVFETRVKFSQKGGSTTGTYTSGKILFALLGDEGTLNSGFTLWSSDGHLGYGGNGDNTGTGIKTDYLLTDGMWYTVRFEFAAGSNKPKMTVTPDEGEALVVEDAYMTSYGVTKIYGVRYSYRFQVASNVDYIRIWDNDLIPKPTASIFYNNGAEDVALVNAKDMPTSFEGKIVYDLPIDPATDLSGITVNGGTVNATLNDDGTEITYSVSGLSAGKAYTLSVPALGESKAAQATFETAMAQYLFNVDFDETDISEYTLSDTNNTITDGILNLPGTAGGTTTKVEFPEPIDLTGRKNVVFETRAKFSQKNGSTDGTISSGKAFFILLGDSGVNNAGFKLSTSDGYLMYGGTGDNAGTGTKTEYMMKDGMWYTIRFEFAAGSNKPKMIIKSDEGDELVVEAANMGAYGVTEIYSVRYSYRFQVASNVDYIRIWDNDLLPQPTATIYDGENLDGTKTVKKGDVIKFTFPEAITEADIEKITFDGTPITDATLSDDGKVVTYLAPEMEARTNHVIVVGTIGEMAESTYRFRSADEGKYLVRYEFDGNDNDAAWYTKLNSNLGGASNSSAQVQNGVWHQTFDNTRYAAFTPTFSTYDGLVFSDKTPKASDYLDVKGKKNITIETKVKVGEGTLDGQFMYIGYNMAMITFSNGAFAYNGDAGSNGSKKAFMVNDDPLLVERDNWYTFKFDIDFESYTYNVSVDDSNGNIANSGPLKFIYNAQRDTIADFRFARQLNNTYAPVDIDYFYIIDNDYGKVEVTYDAGVVANLDGSALVPVADNMFEFTLTEAPSDLTGIALIDENGNKVEFTAVVNNNTVSVIPNANLDYNTKYVLTLDKELIGAENNQEVKFTTVWNPNAEFVYPAGFDKDDEFNVVYFGGSITNQDGWRVTTTNWFKEYFPNSKHINASVGGTGANWGWNRLARDVIPYNPDIVFIEFAVNDSNNMKADRDIESIVRNLNKLDKPPVIIFVYTTVQNFSNNINAIALQENVAKAYGIPSINVHDYAQTRYNTESQFKTDWNGTVYIGGDTTHPTATGSTLYGNYVTALLESDSSKYFVRPAANAFVQPVASDFFDYIYDYTAINKTISDVGSTYEFTVSGDGFTLEYGKKTDAGIFSVSVDGVVVAENIDAYNSSSYVPNSTKIFSGLGEGNHVVTVTVTGKNDASTGTSVKLAAAFTRNYATKVTRPVFNTDKVEAGETVIASTSYYGNEVKDGILLVATYDSSDKMVRLIETKDADFTTGASTNEVFVKVPVTLQSNEVKVKAFVWDSIDTMVPYTVAKELK